jgi:hypothetical protein
MTMRRLPNGSTDDPDVYGEAWARYAEMVLMFFPGYCFTGVSKSYGIVLERRETNDRGKYTTVDTIELSSMACDCLLTRAVPPLQLRKDF